MRVSRPLLLLSVAALCVVAGTRAPSARPVATAPTAREPPSRNEQAEDPSQEAEGLLALSARQNFENHAVALETAGRALSLFQAAGDREGVARAYVQLAHYHSAQYDLTEATQNYDSALQVWQDLNNAPEQARVLIWLGFVESRKGEWRNAVSLYTRAEELLAGYDEPALLGRLAAGLGDVFNENGLPDKGLAQYQRALEEFRRTPDARDDAMAILEIGSSYYLKGDYREALSQLQQVLVTFRPDSLDAAQCHRYLGRVYIAMGEYAAALEHLQATPAIYAQAGNASEAANALALIGQVYEQEGQLVRARQHYRQVLATFTRLTDRINLSAVYYALGRLELKAKNYEAAEELLRNSVEVTENIRRIPTSSDLTAAFSATVHERYESYVECLMREHELQPASGLDVRAFEMSELARARSLAELLRTTRTDLVAGLDPELARREKSLRQALSVKGDMRVALLGGEHKTEDLARLDAELARLETEYAQVNNAILAAHPAYGQLTRPTALDLRGIQEQVITDDRTVLLEFLLGEGKSYVWAVTRDGVRSYGLPERARIAAAAKKAYQAISTPPGFDSAAEITAALQELSGIVLSPVAAELKNKNRIIVVADDVLNYIPFQALKASMSGDEFAIADYEVVNAPSASILGELRQEAAQRPPPAKLLAAFGDPAFPSNYAQLVGGRGQELAALQMPNAEGRQPLSRDVSHNVELHADALAPNTIQPLFYAKRELSSLLDVTAGKETLVASGFAATRERLFGTDLSQYAIAHFATHGLFDPERPEHSGLLLATVAPDGRTLNGFVGLQDIYSLRAPVDLVVLSACRTALGKDVRGEGLLGLTRGFMYAGASGVVASLWKVEDKATAELMRQFYDNMLREGMPPGAALREAQNNIRQNPRWRAPYYWAGFTLQGEYRRPIRSSPGAPESKLKSLAAGAGLLMLLVAATCWYYRRR